MDVLVPLAAGAKVAAWRRHTLYCFLDAQYFRCNMAAAVCMNQWM